MIMALAGTRTVSRRQYWQLTGILAALALAAYAIAALPLPELIAAAAVSAVGLVLLRWPWLIWPLLALLLPISSTTRIGLITLTELLLAVAALLWLVDGSRRRRLALYASPVLGLVLLFAFVLLLSLLRAPSLGDGVAEVVKWAEFAFVLALLPVMLLRGSARWVAAALVTAGVLQSILGLYQFVFRVGPEWFVLFDRYMRASGSFRQPNPYAAYLGVVLPLALSLAIWAWLEAGTEQFGFGSRFAWGLFYAISSVTIAAGLLASWSRGGWIAAATAMVTVVATRSRKGLAFVGVGSILGLTALLFGLFNLSFLPSALVERLQTAAEIFHNGLALSQPVNDSNYAMIERVAHWVAGYRMWESAPWLGIGAGNYAEMYDGFRLPFWTEPLGHAHNLYLNLLAEAGLVGLASFLVMWIGLGVWAWRRRTVETVRPDAMDDSWSRAMAAAALGAMVYLTVHSLVDMLFVQGIYLVLGLLLAVLAAGAGGGEATRLKKPKDSET